MRQGLNQQVKKQIVELRNRGYSYNQISRLLKLTKGQVAGELWRAGLCKKKEKRDDRGTISNIA